MAFFEHRISERISRGSRGGPKWKTTKTQTISGHRRANAEWSAPLHVYDLAFGVRSIEDFDEVLAMFYNVRGAYDGFRMKDFRDFRHSDRNATAVMTLISGSVYQLGKTYTIGARSFTRSIYKPVSGSIAVLRTTSGSTSDITGSSTIDTTNGQVTVTGHTSGDTYAWTGQFDVPVAFVDDTLEDMALDGTAQNLVVNVGPIKVEEIRL